MGPLRKRTKVPRPASSSPLSSYPISTPLPNLVSHESSLLHIDRTLCLLYIIEMFLEINLRPTPISPRCCQSFASTPLPCVRDLWEVPSTYDWSRRYAAFLRGRSAVNKVLTLRDYKLAQHLSPEELLDGVAGSGSVMKDVMRWCEGMDSFGTLVALAATLFKYDVAPSGLGNGIRVG